MIKSVIDLITPESSLKIFNTPSSPPTAIQSFSEFHWTQLTLAFFGKAIWNKRIDMYKERTEKIIRTSVPTVFSRNCQDHVPEGYQIVGGDECNFFGILRKKNGTT